MKGSNRGLMQKKLLVTLMATAAALFVAALPAVTRLPAVAGRGLERRLRAVSLLAVFLPAVSLLALPLLALAWLLVVRLAGRMRLRHGTVVRREERTGRPVAGRLVTHPCEATLAA